MFARAVNENALIKSALEDVILYEVDCEKGEGIEIAKKYKIRGYPTYIAMNGKGEVTDRWIGYRGPEAWAKAAKAAAADPRTIAAKKQAFDADPTVGLAICLANDAVTGADYSGAVNYLGKARELDPANGGDYTQEILENMYGGSRAGAFTFDEIEAEAKMALKKFDPSVEQQIDLAMMLQNIASQTDQPERAVPYITAALKASKGSTDENIAESRTRLQIEYALLVENDKEKALKLFRSTFDEGWQQNAGALNNFAWWCFENDVNLDEAGELALKGVELADTDGQRANILDTVAEICNKLGNCEEAIGHMQRAIELDPDKQYFQDQLTRFEHELQEKQSG